MSTSRHLVFGALAMAFACLFGASQVLAADFFISGRWQQNRGPTINIPPGDDSICFNGAGTVMWPCGRAQVFNGPVIGVEPATKPVGAAAITGTALNVPGVPVKVPAGLIDWYGGIQGKPVPFDAAVNQLDTSFMFFAPVALRAPVRPNITPVGIGPNQHPGTANTRLMHGAAWMDPGQNGRVAPNFVVSWVDPNNRFQPHPVASETVFNASTPLPFTRRVSYTSNANAFGGTMGMMLSGFARVWVAVPITPDAGPELIRSPVSGMGTQHVGRGYFSTATRVAPPGMVYNGVVQNPPCAPNVLPPSPPDCEIIVNIVGPLLFNLPGATTINFGFPLTTGRVVVQGNWVQAGNPRITTLSAEGGDTTMAGVRYLNLVSGGNALRNSVSSGFTRTLHLDGATIALPEPGVALAFGSSLALVGLLYALRQRLFA